MAVQTTLRLPLGVLRAAAMAVCLGLAALPAGAKDFYVSPKGNDGNPGTSGQPFLTPQRAVAAADAAGGSNTIALAPGEYLSPQSLTISTPSPLVLRGAPDGSSTLISGTRIAPTQFKPVTDSRILQRLTPAARTQVRQLDLSGLKLQHIGPMPDRFTGSGGLLQLLVNGQRMPLARFPADGYLTIQTVLDSGITPKPHGGTFVYRGDVASHWSDAVQDGLWAVGFWRVPWQSQAVRVASIDPSRKSITLAAPVQLGIGSKYSREINGTRAGDGKEPWYALNLLEALQRPGQWVIQSRTKTLYFWPPEGFTNADVVFCDNDGPVVLLSNAREVTLDHVNIVGGLATGLGIKGGSDNSVVGCRIRDAAGVGVQIDGGHAHRIESCDICAIGAEAIRVDAGDRATLTPGKVQILNNHLHDFAQLDTGCYAVDVAGVGNRVAHNLIHDGPLGGIQYHGNDQVIELNEIHNLGLDGGDLGAIYSGSDWASRGNTVRYNLIHHLPNGQGTYLDDGHSGDLVYGNIYAGVRSGIFIGGGHDNLAWNNLIVQCQVGLHVDDRGKTRNYTLGSGGALERSLKTLPYTKEPWRTRYPDLLRMLNNPGMLPVPTGDRLIQNAIIACGKTLDFDPTNPRFSGVVADDNLALPLDQAALSDSAKLDFKPSAKSPLLQTLPALSTIPFADIGLQASASRPTLPTDAETGRYQGRTPRQLFDSNVDVQRSNELEHRP
ncbi:MAG: right-handed parallel beta-helix repeat-containing protein [Tepidisphaeraceae bacterium]